MGQVDLWSRSPPRVFTYIRNPFNFTLLRKLHPDSGFAACSVHPAKPLHHHPGDSLCSWSAFNVSYISWLPFLYFFHILMEYILQQFLEKRYLKSCNCADVFFSVLIPGLIMWLDTGFRVGIHFLPSLFFCPPFWDFLFNFKLFTEFFFF